MGGYFAHIGLDEWDKVYKGTTHGCGCCARYDVKLTSQDIEEHIESLKADIKAARKALRYTRRLESQAAKEEADVSSR